MATQALLPRKILVRNIGVLALGDPSEPIHTDTTVCIEDGVVTAIGDDMRAPDLVIDAAGLSAIPGLVDGHVHPTFGQWTPAQDSIGWIDNYLHGGTTQMVSAGELHVPGLNLEQLDAETAISLAKISKETTGRIRQSGVKLHSGTVLLVSGMTETDFDRLKDSRIRHLKFIFYDWGRSDWSEAQDYVRWGRERGMVVKIHSGGVSRSGSSRVAGHEVVTAVDPDVIAHISGGPIPMPDEEITRVIDDLPNSAVEICSSMNYRATKLVVDHLTAVGGLSRMTVGTDTPGGTGVIPRGMLRNICYLSSVCGMDPLNALAAATFNTARAHRVEGGSLTPGSPADMILCGPITGSTGDNALDCFRLGDLPGVSMVMIDGEPLVMGRSRQTPPPRSLATADRP